MWQTGFPGGARGKELICPCQRHKRHEFNPWIRKISWIHSSILAWRIPLTEEPGRLQSLGSHRVRHNWSDLAGTDIDMRRGCYLPTEASVMAKRSYWRGHILSFVSMICIHPFCSFLGLSCYDLCPNRTKDRGMEWGRKMQTVTVSSDSSKIIHEVWFIGLGVSCSIVSDSLQPHRL